MLLLNCNLKININTKNNDLVIWNYKILENQQIYLHQMEQHQMMVILIKFLYVYC